ncbi:ABC transporter ATP-binding protein [Anaerocolumna chitinilytica]|uniref:ABC transporter ATP-binding protein n=1 Tax=Anaerocolumna chitinilytica TaxID=1727145 RepID=A0A7I8DJY0_9FIRM|nr:ABC transporter ATP-binding protein [Anaerocolumna chitinilytica]BCJ98719.1 ABC transporter ATP-binding protein [Anaerocolumna chitinilytica]
MYAMELNHITKGYLDGDRENLVLNDISLKVNKGEFIAILGPSGSGKSTLLTIAGMLLSADKGNIIINGSSMDEMKQKEWTKIRREKLGFIFQNHQLLPYLTAEEQLILAADMKPFSSKEERNSTVDELLAELGISSCKKKYPKQMSGGEKQRVAIARAFINRPEVILADEPTASLDGTRGRQIAEMIRQEVKHRNTAAIMVTHDERILDLVDRVYRLEQGKLLLSAL